MNEIGFMWHNQYKYMETYITNTWKELILLTVVEMPRAFKNDTNIPTDQCIIIAGVSCNSLHMALHYDQRK